MKLENIWRSRPKPPIEWFTGFCLDTQGTISMVGVDDNFTNLANGQVGKHFDAWVHYRGNPVTSDDPPERKERVAKAIKDAEDFITINTGFSPQEISDMARELNKQYKGKKEAPINIAHSFKNV